MYYIKFVPYDASIIHTGWATCNGQLLNISDYPGLYAIISNTYGGDGITTFALPNLVMRTAVSSGAGSGLTVRAVGDSFGEQTHALTIAEMPAHQHNWKANSSSTNTPQPTNNSLGRIGMYDPTVSGSNLANGSIANSGVGAPHNNLSPLIYFQAIITLVDNDDITFPGEIRLFLNASMPTANWLLADGSAVSRSTYNLLAGVATISTTGNTYTTNIIDTIPDTSNMRAGMPISGTDIPAATTITSVDSSTQIHISNAATGTHVGASLSVCPWGVGNGTTTFNLPDMKGRMAVCDGLLDGNVNTTEYVLGQIGGLEVVSLITNQIPPHTHAVQAVDGRAIASQVATAAGNWLTESVTSNTYQTNTPNVNLGASAVRSKGSGTAHNNIMQSFCLAWGVSIQ